MKEIKPNTQQTTHSHESTIEGTDIVKRKVMHGLTTGITACAISSDKTEIGLLWEISMDSVHREERVYAFLFFVTKLFNIS